MVGRYQIPAFRSLVATKEPCHVLLMFRTPLGPATG
jgi:hypothetical protein